MILKKQILQEILNNPIVKLAPSQINGAGVGVFALSKIETEEIVFDTNTNIFIKWGEINGIEENILKYIQQMCHYNDQGFWIDRPVNKINSSYYVNHSEDPNLYHDTKTDTFIAIKTIEIGEELTCVYPLDERDWC
jgi:hypothetical protein